MDITAYAARSATFPHQATADLFFDESQFEVYRRLGLRIGEAGLAAGEAEVIGPGPTRGSLQRTP